MLGLKQLQSLNESSNSSQFAVPVVSPATRDCIRISSAMEMLLHISEDNALKATFIGSSAAGAVHAYPQLVVFLQSFLLAQYAHHFTSEYWM
jgi:hypothetical protein